MYNKNIKLKIIVMFIIFMVPMMLFSFKASFCLLGLEEDYLGKKAPIIVSITGKPNQGETIFKYEIKPEKSNLKGATNEPTELTVVLNSESDKVSDGRLSKTEYIDFSNTTYIKPGVYKYLITEKYSSNETEFPLDTQKYRIAIEAVEEPDGSISHSFYKYAYDLNNDTKEEKIAFNHTQMTYVKFQMKTTGELADKDQYFKLTVSIFGRAGEVYNIFGQDNIVTYNNEQIKTLDSFEVTDGKYSFDIYLKNDQVAYIGSKTENGQVLYQIPVGTYISIVENDARKYQTFINEEEGKVKRNFYLTSNEENNVINVVNHADYDVAMTGVFFSRLPYIILIIIVIIVLAFLIYKKIKGKKSDEDN